MRRTPETRPLSDLGDGNAGTRAMSEAAAAGLGYSLAEFGDLSGIVLNSTAKGLEKIAGHQRLAQLEAAGAVDLHVEREPDGDTEGAGYVLHPQTGARFPVRIVRWPAAKAKAARYAANAATIAGEFTPLALPELRALAVLPELAPLRLDDLARMIPGPPVETVEDEAPAPPVNPVSRTGDLWLLDSGKGHGHRLGCMDSTKAEDVARVMGGERAAMVFCDPPYAIYGSATGVSSSIADDGMVRPFFRDVLALSVASVEMFGHIYLCCDWRSWPSWWEMAKRAGATPKNLIVWDKGGSGLGSSYVNTYELVGFFARLPVQVAMKSSAKDGGQRQVHRPNVMRFDRPHGEERQHNAAKPVALVTEFFTNGSDKGAIVADWFCGSGPTLIAGEMTGRCVRALEVEPRFADVAVRRWQNFTGNPARLALPSGEPGPTFADVAADRGIVLPSEGED